MNKIIKLCAVIFCAFFISSLAVNAHQGTTDVQGGHADPQNVSGIGTYHYHCGSNPAHLHSNGVCPYTASVMTLSSTRSTEETKSTEDKKKKDTITIHNAPESLTLGEVYELDATIKYTSKKKYSLTSSDEGIIRIDGDNLVAVGVGRATITLKSYNNSKSFETEVKPIPVESIEVEEEVEMQLGTTYQLEPVVKPDDATYKDLRFESSNERAVIVNGEGALEAVSVGRSEITIYASDDVEATVQVKVYEIEPEEIRTNKEDFQIYIMDTDKLEIEIYPEEANNAEYSISLKNNNIIQLDEDGTITPINTGETTIFISTWNELEKEVHVTVYHTAVTDVRIDDSRIEYESSNTVDIESEIYLEAVVYPEDATYPEVTWKSSNENVISVDINGGNFEIVGTGEATLTASTSDGISQSITIKVTDKKIGTFLLLAGGVVIGTGSLGFILVLVLKKMQKNKAS